MLKQKQIYLNQQIHTYNLFTHTICNYTPYNNRLKSFNQIPLNLYKTSKIHIPTISKPGLSYNNTEPNSYSNQHLLIKIYTLTINQ
jgi:hypothetical protein